MSDLRKEADRRHTLYIWLAAALILLVMTVMGGVFYHNAKKQNFERRLLRLGADNARLRRESDSSRRSLKIVEEEKKAWSDYARELRQQLDSNNGQTSGAADGVDFILESKERLNSLVDKYLLLPTSENGEIRRSLQKEIRTYDAPEFHERVDSVINSRFDGYMVKARETRLSKTELSLLRLLICGFSNSQIGVILDVGQGALSTRKSRLKSKIEKLGLQGMPYI